MVVDRGRSKGGGMLAMLLALSNPFCSEAGFMFILISHTSLGVYIRNTDGNWNELN